MSSKVGIVGLGRIGRGVLRANFSRKPDNRFGIKVICDIMPIDHIAYLLAHDSTYGRPNFSVDYQGDDLILNGVKIHYQRVDRRRSSPEDDSFGVLRDFNLDVLFDATGTANITDFRAILAGNIAKNILCTWNVSGGDLSLVYGVNHQDFQPEKHKVISASTCTGNALVPLFYILDKHFGIEHARVITIHPQLSDQRVLDGYHAASQLGRTSACSIIPTSTNVGKSTELVLPSLAGKIDSLSYRVPTAVVSIIDANVTLATDTTIDDIIQLFNKYADTQLKGIIDCEYGAFGHQKASIDYLGTEFSAIILMANLSLSQNRQLGLSLMHDNEYGYCCRVLDILGVVADRY